LEALERAEILYAQHRLLLALDRTTFRRLILHSDPGTMVLEAPPGLSGAPASLA